MLGWHERVLSDNPLFLTHGCHALDPCFLCCLALVHARSKGVRLFVGLRLC